MHHPEIWNSRDSWQMRLSVSPGWAHRAPTWVGVGGGYPSRIRTSRLIAQLAQRSGMIHAQVSHETPGWNRSLYDTRARYKTVLEGSCRCVQLPFNIVPLTFIARRPAALDASGSAEMRHKSAVSPSAMCSLPFCRQLYKLTSMAKLTQVDAA